MLFYLTNFVKIDNFDNIMKEFIENLFKKRENKIR
jgi:predicted PolB exonuclease-like 3'-5' exonuclease